MKKNQQLITNLETKITKIQTFINNWKQEIMNYEKKLQEIINQVSQLKTNSNITK